MKSGQNTFVTFLELLKVKHTGEFSNRYFNEHPHKYNLFGLSRMLFDYGVEIAGIKVADKEKDIAKIPPPFIAHFEGEFVVVRKVEPDIVSFLWSGNDYVRPITEFVKAWSGVVLLAESSEKSIEPDYKEHKKIERFNFLKKIILFSICFLILLLTYIQQYLHLLSHSVIQLFSYLIILLINLTGIYFSYLLLLKQMHFQSQYADKICSVIKYNDCNNVLETKAAKLFGVISWSEVGLGYFVSNLFILFFIPNFIVYSTLINIITLPYTFWSIWYQKFIIKQWCVLCIIIQGLLWIIFLTNLSFRVINIPSFDFIELLSVATIYILPYLIINLLIPLINSSKDNVTIKQKMNELKMTQIVFNSLLKEEPYEVNKDISKIIFGNPGAQNRVTVFSNPHCGPCAALHEKVKKLLDKMKDKICVQYIFTSFAGEYEKSTLFLIAAYFNNSKEHSQKMYDEWFWTKQYYKEEYFDLHHYDLESEEVKMEREKHKKWRDDSKLHFTPTVLINGYKLPNLYEIEDLEYLL